MEGGPSDMLNAMVVPNFPTVRQIHMQYLASSHLFIHLTAIETALVSTEGSLPRYSNMSAKPIIAATWIGCTPICVQILNRNIAKLASSWG